MTVRRGRWWVVLVVLAAILSGCGGDDDDGDASGPAADADGSTVEDDAPPATAEGGGVRYLAIGDSLTQGVGAPDESTGAFPVVLAEEWRADGCEVELLNVGISGYTAAQMITDQLPNLADFGPTIVTFQSGGNDIANGITIDQYRTDVGTILDETTGSGARVLVLMQNDWSKAPAAADYGDPETIAEQRIAFDEVLVEEAEERGAEVVDLRAIHERTADEGLWVEDGLHPTEEVYAEWATAIADAVPAPCE